MSYEHKSNVRNSRLPFSIKIVIVISIVLFVFYFLFPRFFPGLMTALSKPFFGIETIDNTSAFLKSTEFQNAVITELQKENSDLKALMHHSSTSTSPYIAYIIKKPPFTAYDSYLIDIGKNSEIKVGAKVYAIGNVLLGEIVEINGTVAKVKLYSSYGEKYDVLVGKKNIQAVANGLGGGAFEVVLPKDADVYEGDTVTIPDLDVSVFGIVKNIEVQSARSFSTVLFSQPLNIYEQKWVLIKSKNDNGK